MQGPIRKQYLQSHLLLKRVCSYFGGGIYNKWIFYHFKSSFSFIDVRGKYTHHDRDTTIIKQKTSIGIRIRLWAKITKNWWERGHIWNEEHAWRLSPNCPLVFVYLFVWFFLLYKMKDLILVSDCPEYGFRAMNFLLQSTTIRAVLKRLWRDSLKFLILYIR